MIKLFEQFNNEQEIREICEKYNIKNYIINTDGNIDVDGNINLSSRGLFKLPLKFNVVSGVFYCNDNNLISLEGCPKEVGGNFSCVANKLKSLIGSPKIVGGVYTCSDNYITSLEECPERVGKFINLNNNQLTSLEGCPIMIGDDLSIQYNPISIIDTSIQVKGKIHIKYTNFDDKVKSLSQEKLKILFEHGIDYNIFDKDGNVNHSRLERIFKDFGV